MKAIKTEGNNVTFADEKQEKEKQHQVKLASLADKKKHGKLTLGDIYEQNQIIIEMMTERYE